MKNIVNSYVRKFRAEHRRSQRMAAMLAALALLVAAGVAWQLHATGIAMTNETFCGLEEHTHTEDCYEKVLACGLKESEGHTHTDACYEEKKELVCGLEESEGHTHTDDCYDADGNLICGLKESEGHTHTDACYETEKVLVCGLEESEGHTHTDDCYEEQLTCGLEEHTHTVECLIDETADVETSDDWEKTLPEKLTGVWADDVVAVAENQIGYTESTANFTLDDDDETRKGYTRYGAWAGNEYGDWDAMFASFCLHYAGISKKDFPEATGAYAWFVSLKKIDLYQAAEDYTPVAGDLVFFDTDEDGKIDRVGIVSAVNEKKEQLTVIEGDYEEDDADAVCKNKYALNDSEIVGYGTVAEAQELADADSSENDEALTEQTLTATADDATITVSGLLPEGATVTATPVEVEDNDLDIVMAFDISIYYADGTEFEPEDDTISVTIESDEISGNNNVYYIPDEGDAEKMNSEAEDGAVVFDAEHFSTYVIAEDGDDDTGTTTSTISTTYTDENGNEATLTISSSSGTDLLTGQAATLSITLGLHGSIDLGDNMVRVYLSGSDTDVAVYGSENVEGTAWVEGSNSTFTINREDGSTGSATITLCMDENDQWYLDINTTNMQGGDTVNFTIALTYPNQSSDGGTVEISGEIGEDTSSTLTFEWATHTNTYSVTKSASGTPTFTSAEDDDKIYLTGLAYSVTSKKLSTYSDYGKDPVSIFRWTDTVSLPDGLSWRTGLIDAIQNNQYNITNDNSTVTVTVEGETYTLCTVSQNFSFAVNIDGVCVDDNGNIQITWYYNCGSVQYEDNVLGKAYTVTYGDQVIVCDASEIGTYSEESYEISNTVTADFSFKFSDEPQSSTATATTTATLKEGTLELKKETEDGIFYMGSSYDFTITAENPEALPYSGLAYIEDSLGDWLYIKPDDMEKLLDEYGDSLTITINQATIYEKVSNEVYDVNGEKKTITQQEQGTGTTYTGAKNGSGTLTSSDSGISTTDSITLTQMNGLINMSVGSYNYTIGTGGQYSSLSEALDDIGYYVSKDTVYTLRWDLGEDYILNGNTALEYTYTATVKDTFMRLDGDLFYDLNQSDSQYWTQDNVSVGGNATNTVIAYDENRDMLRNAQISKAVYRDFVLTKGYTISGSSLTTGSIVTYTVKVKHEGTASYDALPLVDQLDDGQVLLVPVSKNSSNDSLSELDTTTVDGAEYYILDEAGTYGNVWINSSVMANQIVVSNDGSTLIYCYLVVNDTGTTSIKYTTLVKAEGDADSNDNGFALKNQVWLNDHETHRLYAETSLNGSVLSIDKQIVTEQGDTPSEDVTVTNSVLSDSGEVVTYRLELKNNSDTAITVTGDNIYDILPKNVSGDAWTKSDVSLRVYDQDGEITVGALADWADDSKWSIIQDTENDT